MGMYRHKTEKPQKMERAEHERAGQEVVAVDEDILLWLVKHPFQRIEDLSFALGVHPSTMYRHVIKLLAGGYVESVKPSLGRTNTHALYYLTTKGIATVADRLDIHPVVLAKKNKVDEQGLLTVLPRIHLSHVLQNFIQCFVEQVPTFPEFRQSALRWHWVHDYQQSYHYKGKKETLTVDASLVFAQGKHAYYCIFLLLDPGFVGNNDKAMISDRLEQFFRFRESVERQTWYQHMPPVIVLTSSLRSQHIWQRCAQEVEEHLRVAPLKGAIVPVSYGQDFQSVWSLPWQHIAQRTRIHLQNIIEAMPKEAIPEGLLASKSAWQSDSDAQNLAHTKVIVKGQLTQRATKVYEPPMNNIALEKERVALLGVQAHRRHLDILFMLYAYPFLSKEELATFFTMEPDTIRRYLYDLKQCHCVEEVTVPGFGKRYRADVRGLRLVATIQRVSLSHVSVVQPDGTRVQRGTPYMVRTLRHTTGIYRFITRLYQEAWEQNHQLRWWETGARCASRYRYQGAWHNLFPDALFEYQTAKQKVVAWLEWDEGTMRRDKLMAKMKAYAHYVQSRQWTKEYGMLPMLLVVVPDKSQEVRWYQVVQEEVVKKCSPMVYVTTATRLEHDGMLGMIWWPLHIEWSGKDQEIKRIGVLSC